MKLSDLLLALESPEKFAWIDTSNDRENVLEFINEAGSFSDSSRFFLGGFEFGPDVLVHVEGGYRGDGFEAAYEAWIDSMPTIPDEELVEAYGMPGKGSFLDEALDAARPTAPNYFGAENVAWSKAYHDAARKAFDAAFEAAQDTGDYPEIIEDYQQNSNGGVVDVGHYQCFQEADLDCIELRRLCDKHDDCKTNNELALACATKA